MYLSVFPHRVIQNVVKAVEMARNTGMHTIAFTGEGGGKLGNGVDLTLAIPSTVTARIQNATFSWSYHLRTY